MTGFSLYVAVKLRPASLVVEFTPAGDTDEDEPEGEISGRAEDDVIAVEDFDGTFVNRMGFAPAPKGK